MLVTPLFAAIFALLYVVLSFSVIRKRLSGQVVLGDGEDKQLLTSIRIHGNFAEYVPFALLMMWFLENALYDSRLAFVLGVILLVGRVCHVVGMRNPRNLLILRQVGMLATFGVLIAASVRLLILYIPVEYLSLLP